MPLSNPPLPCDHWKNLTPTEARLALAHEPDITVLEVSCGEDRVGVELIGSSSRRMPLEKVLAGLHMLDPRCPYLVVSRDGLDSQEACRFLASQGFTRLRNLQEGIAHWRATGLPVTLGSSESVH